MPTSIIQREPLARRPADRAERYAPGACDCRADALEALGRLAELTLALGIHDLDVWRGLTRLEARLTGEPLPPHTHVLGNVH